MGLKNLEQIVLLVTDVDGVMTDGRILVTDQGETKAFSVRDGLGIKLMQKAGVEVAILSGRASVPLMERARELGIKHVKTGRLDKQTALEEIMQAAGVHAGQVAYIGDDLPDIAPLQMAAAAFCPQDAAAEVCAVADLVVPIDGGRGVVRHVAEVILKAQGAWAPMVQAFEVRP